MRWHCTLPPTPYQWSMVIQEAYRCDRRNNVCICPVVHCWIGSAFQRLNHSHEDPHTGDVRLQFLLCLCLEETALWWRCAFGIIASCICHPIMWAVGFYESLVGQPKKRAWIWWMYFSAIPANPMLTILLSYVFVLSPPIKRKTRPLSKARPHHPSTLTKFFTTKSKNQSLSSSSSPFLADQANGIFSDFFPNHQKLYSMRYVLSPQWLYAIVSSVTKKVQQYSHHRCAPT